jgi:hypothetical protein
MLKLIVGAVVLECVAVLEKKLMIFALHDDNKNCMRFCRNLLQFSDHHACVIRDTRYETEFGCSKMD